MIVTTCEIEKNSGYFSTRTQGYRYRRYHRIGSNAEFYTGMCAFYPEYTDFYENALHLLHWNRRE